MIGVYTSTTEACSTQKRKQNNWLKPKLYKAIDNVGQRHPSVPENPHLIVAIEILTMVHCWKNNRVVSKLSVCACLLLQLCHFLICRSFVLFRRRLSFLWLLFAFDTQSLFILNSAECCYYVRVYQQSRVQRKHLIRLLLPEVHPFFLFQVLEPSGVRRETEPNSRARASQSRFAGSVRPGSPILTCLQLTILTFC